MQPVAQQPLPLGFLRDRLRHAYSRGAGRRGTGHAITSYDIDGETGNRKDNQQAGQQGAQTGAGKRIVWPPHLE